MKLVKITAIVFSLAAMMFSFNSCSKDDECCTLADDSKVCEDDYPGSLIISWGDYKAAQELAGAKCD